MILLLSAVSFYQLAILWKINSSHFVIFVRSFLFWGRVPFFSEYHHNRMRDALKKLPSFSFIIHFVEGEATEEQVSVLVVLPHWKHRAFFVRVFSSPVITSVQQQTVVGSQFGGCNPKHSLLCFVWYQHTITHTRSVFILVFSPFTGHLFFLISSTSINRTRKNHGSLFRRWWYRGCCSWNWTLLH